MSCPPEQMKQDQNEIAIRMPSKTTFSNVSDQVFVQVLVNLQNTFQN